MVIIVAYIFLSAIILPEQKYYLPLQAESWLRFYRTRR
jgi:hypothetical protein